MLRHTRIKTHNYIYCTLLSILWNRNRIPVCDIDIFDWVLYKW